MRMVTTLSGNSEASVTLPDAKPAFLATECHGRPGDPYLLLVHGFGQTRHAWAGCATALALEGFQAISFDLRGHGDSARAPDGQYELQQFLDDVLRMARSLEQPPVLVGASMGGLLGLALAGEVAPSPFRALVLVDITPRWESAGVERMLAFMQRAPGRIRGLQPKRPQPSRPICRIGARQAERELRTAVAPWRGWPAALALGPGIAGQRSRTKASAPASPAGGGAPRSTFPCCCCRADARDVVSRDTVDEFLRLVPHARHVQMPHATHMLAGDSNDAFIVAIVDFIRSLPERRRHEASVMHIVLILIAALIVTGACAYFRSRLWLWTLLTAIAIVAVGMTLHAPRAMEIVLLIFVVLSRCR